MVWPEEGFGDQIQYARFAKALAERGVRLTWFCLPQLASLFAANLGVEVIRAEGEAALPEADFWIWSSSLPALFGDADLPTAPYLSATPRPIGGRIGVISRGNPKQVNDAARSLSPAAVEALLSLPGAVSLLPEDTGARDFQETAELISGLDLVITVDTAGAHLAGAMGKPCWVMLARLGADWRWTPFADRSLWYPSMRLYRQPAPGVWDSVLEQIRRDLPA
ncbi:glycosyltransferase family 9 protein [Phenylobacterium sp. J367]|uniref:glycosyltransferase family 9 protein n=1 Tax=Phenylobacterium sp. J367 TaxID=2898435 RepID=UPI0021510CB2|nr:glycosyltransferase family 9 protein [Phenylobacterium sp. J367]MCR5878323.1 hypothetical protein [Phenylobacterium sp. J367]